MYIHARSLTFSLIHTETTTEMPSPFVAETSPIFVEENSSRELVWKIINCDWQVRVVIENYTLYPNLIPEQVPIKRITDYNVTETCEEDHTIVNFSIFFNENVLENSIDYVVCKIYRSNKVGLIFESRINFTSSMPFSSTTDTEATDTTDQNAKIPRGSANILIETTVATTGSGYRLSVQFMTLNLGLIVANILSWIPNIY